MSKIVSQGPSPSIGKDAERSLREDALADVKKGTQEKVEATKSERTEGSKEADAKTAAKRPDVIKDGFASKSEGNKFTTSKADVEKAQAQFKQEFPADIVEFVEKGLKANIDPQKALKLKNQMSTDPKAKQVVQLFKVALEEGAQKVLQKRLDEASKAKPGEGPGGPEKSEMPVAQRSAEARFTKAADGAKLDSKSIDGKKLEGEAKKADASKTEAKKSEAADDKKTDDKKDTKADAEQGPKAEDDGVAQADSTAESDAATDADAADAETIVAEDDVAASASQTDDSEIDTNTQPDALDDDAALGLSGEDGTPPSWGGGGGGTQPLSASETKASMAFQSWMQDMGSGEVAELALLVLAQAVNDTSNDMKIAQKMLKMHHQINDAMRAYSQRFSKEMAGLKAGEAREWQHMNFDIGYDANGEMVVQSYPDLSAQTAKYEDVEGKGADDMSPEESFVAAHGQEGIEEARQGGTLRRIDGNTVVGMTSHSIVKSDTLTLERDRIKSKLSEMKTEGKKVTLTLQRSMDMRKNLLEQFAKIADARADNWDQNIAMLLR